jgi:hypothetical protein
VLIRIDLHSGGVTLRDPDDFTRFSALVEGDGDRSRLEQVVRAAGLGRVSEDGDHVVVDPAGLRALAGPGADAGWDEGLSGMVAYAASKGWVEDDGGVLAHIERDDTTD